MEKNMPYEDEIPPHGNLMDVSEELNLLSHAVIGAAIEVHRHLGPGLPEEVYERAMDVELSLRGIPFERQKPIEIVYKNVVVGRGKIDLLVGGRLVVEIKTVDALIAKHRLQARSYMRVIHEALGLLINFDVVLLKDGIRRVIDSDPF
ncbi:MAG TPA: GxxExxY protein [Humisphaera sp.]|jgi:GxxExxY protein|nr:GxxExxY protein [Humisphaera sp.]